MYDNHPQCTCPNRQCEPSLLFVRGKPAGLGAKAERFRKRHYPARIQADKLYRNRDNLSYREEHSIQFSGPSLGRPEKGEGRNKAQDY